MSRVRAFPKLSDEKVSIVISDDEDSIEVNTSWKRISQENIRRSSKKIRLGVANGDKSISKNGEVTVNQISAVNNNTPDSTQKTSVNIMQEYLKNIASSSNAHANKKKKFVPVENIPEVPPDNFVPQYTYIKRRHSTKENSNVIRVNRYHSSNKKIAKNSNSLKKKLTEAKRKSTDKKSDTKRNDDSKSKCTNRGKSDETIERKTKIDKTHFSEIRTLEITEKTSNSQEKKNFLQNLETSTELLASQDSVSPSRKLWTSENASKLSSYKIPKNGRRTSKVMSPTATEILNLEFEKMKSNGEFPVNDKCEISSEDDQTASITNVCARRPRSKSLLCVGKSNQQIPATGTRSKSVTFRDLVVYTDFRVTRSRSKHYCVSPGLTNNSRRDCYEDMLCEEPNVATIDTTMNLTGEQKPKQNPKSFRKNNNPKTKDIIQKALLIDDITCKRHDEYEKTSEDNEIASIMAACAIGGRRKSTNHAKESRENVSSVRSKSVQLFRDAVVDTDFKVTRSRSRQFCATPGLTNNSSFMEMSPKSNNETSVARKRRKSVNLKVEENQKTPHNTRKRKDQEIKDSTKQKEAKRSDKNDQIQDGKVQELKNLNSDRRGKIKTHQDVNRRSHDVNRKTADRNKAIVGFSQNAVDVESQNSSNNTSQFAKTNRQVLRSKTLGTELNTPKRICEIPSLQSQGVKKVSENIIKGTSTVGRNKTVPAPAHQSHNLTFNLRTSNGNLLGDHQTLNAKIPTAKTLQTEESGRARAVQSEEAINKLKDTNKSKNTLAVDPSGIPRVNQKDKLASSRQTSNNLGNPPEATKTSRNNSESVTGTKAVAHRNTFTSESANQDGNLTPNGNVAQSQTLDPVTTQPSTIQTLINELQGSENTYETEEKGNQPTGDTPFDEIVDKFSQFLRVHYVVIMHCSETAQKLESLSMTFLDKSQHLAMFKGAMAEFAQRLNTWFFEFLDSVPNQTVDAERFMREVRKKAESEIQAACNEEVVHKAVQAHLKRSNKKNMFNALNDYFNELKKRPIEIPDDDVANILGMETPPSSGCFTDEDDLVDTQSTVTHPEKLPPERQNVSISNQPVNLPEHRLPNHRSKYNETVVRKPHQQLELLPEHRRKIFDQICMYRTLSSRTEWLLRERHREKCVCQKPAYHLCTCAMVRYCSRLCQASDWPQHSFHHSRYMREKNTFV